MADMIGEKMKIVSNNVYNQIKEYENNRYELFEKELNLCYDKDKDEIIALDIHEFIDMIENGVKLARLAVVNGYVVADAIMFGYEIIDDFRRKNDK